MFRWWFLMELGPGHATHRSRAMKLSRTPQTHISGPLHVDTKYGCAAGAIIFRKDGSE